MDCLHAWNEKLIAGVGAQLQRQIRAEKGARGGASPDPIQEMLRYLAMRERRIIGVAHGARAHEGCCIGLVQRGVFGEAFG